jgi:transposase
MPGKPPSIELDPEKLGAFLKRAEQCLDPEDFAFLSSLVLAVSNLRDLLQSKSSSIMRLLRMIFGVKTETSKRILKDSPSEAPGIARPAPKGHGRNGARNYTGARKVDVDHDSLKHGDQCPQCERGRVYHIDPGVLMNFFAVAPIQAVLYLLEKLRCNLCGEIFTASKPIDASEKKYDETVGAMVALSRYGFGIPFHRLGRLQAGCGIPLPASTQWEIVDEDADTLKPVFEYLIREGAQAERIYQDDTTMRVLALNAPTKKEEGKNGERCGTFTTGLVCESQDKTIACFFTGVQHAGENLRDLLMKRLSDLSPPIQMCDALSRNMSEDLLTILCNCMSHARRNFVDIIDAFPEECRFVIDILAKVYHHDGLAKEQNLTPHERLRFHREKSAPLMDELKSWMETQLDEKKIEPNSGMGKAIQYMLKRWERFTLFLKVPGAPLDNNICERALKMAIRHRRNSLFYKTERGAWVGDLFMSLIHTCNLMGVNAFEYLTALLRNATRLAQDPGRWMPWSYKDALTANPP